MSPRRPLLLLTILVLAGGVGLWRWMASPKPIPSTAPKPEQPLAGGELTSSGKFTPTAAAKPTGPASAEELQRAAQDYIRETGPDELQIGAVTLHRRKRTISFPAKVAERERPLEYALVHETGKTHEALLSTGAAVQDVHLAALLLDAVGQAPQMEVTWRKHGGEAKVPLHELIGMKEGQLDAIWLYNGSEFIHGGFAASREGSLVALMNDPSALINHPAGGALMRDDVFFAQTTKLPPAGVTVTVILTMPSQP